MRVTNAGWRSERGVGSDAILVEDLLEILLWRERLAFAGDHAGEAALARSQAAAWLALAPGWRDRFDALGVTPAVTDSRDNVTPGPGDAAGPRSALPRA